MTDMIKYLAKLSRQNKPFFWLLLISVIIFCFVYVIFFLAIPDKTIGSTLLKNESANSTNAKIDSNLYHYGRTNDKINYVTVSSDSIIITDNFNKIREQKIEFLLKKADSILTAKGHSGYGQHLLQYLRKKDELGKIIIGELKSRFIFYIEEEIKNDEENDKSYYNVSLSLEKNGSGDVNTLISFVSDKICIENTINRLIFVPLKTSNIVKVTFYDIYSNLCIDCPRVETVRKMIKECNSNECDNIYFERGQYKLSFISKMILSSLYSRLQKDNANNIEVEFHGFTDATSYNGSSSYNERSYITKNGDLINNNLNSNIQQLKTISNNDELSFARAFSCFDFINSQKDNNIKFYYTGWGINKEYSSDIKKRSVLIIVKKTNTHGRNI